MSTLRDEEIKRWTAKRKTALVPGQDQRFGGQLDL